MNSRWALLSTMLVCSLSAAESLAAPVAAVMPVQGVNLTEGQCDAIGLLFSNAFARDSHVAVSSPAETKAVWGSTRGALPAAQRLGASQYVELSAIRLGSKVNLAGILHDANGSEIYRAETSAPSLDVIDTAAAALAQALIWRQPAVVPTYFAAPRMPEPLPEPVLPPVVETPSEPASPSTMGNMFGMKAGLQFPMASGRSLSPQVSFQFDGRIGPRQHFLEVGAGIAVPTDDNNYSSNHDLRVTTFFIELGGSVYLTDGSAGLYIGGGIAPGLWDVAAGYDATYSETTRSASGAMFPIYGQIGMNFTRDIRTRIFAEFRVSQHLLSISDVYANGKSYYPTVLALQMGVGW
jgi:hypothetical protein